MQVWQKFKYKMNVQTNMNALIVKNHANLYGLSQKLHDRIEIFWEKSFFQKVQIVRINARSNQE